MEKNPRITVSEKHPVMVPFWVVAAFKRKQLPMSDVLNYTQVRQVLSVEDAALLLSLQQLYVAPFIQDNYLGYLLSSWESSASVEQKVELNSTVVPLSYSEGSRQSNLLRLQPDNGNFNDTLVVEQPNQADFELLDFNRETFAIVMNRGFLASVTQVAGQITLVKAILKLFYVYLKVENVSKHNIFVTYVKLLNSVVWNRPAL